jgi:ATP-dependent helicase HrpB
MSALPIEAVLPELKDALLHHMNAVLVAAPGAGKTTRVPLALLNEAWLKGRKILMLEPRRLAARAAARYMASMLGEQVGDTIGYRVKMDTKVGPKTRIEVITEGVLTRMLQADPALEQVGIVIFDEFHERSLHADLGLALCLQSQSLLREDLKLLVMSATLQAEPIAELLHHAPIVQSEGRSYPVETRYLDKPYSGRIEELAARMAIEALREQEGDLMIFLPGAAEIRRTEAKLRASQLGHHVIVAPLFGNLSQEAQDRAISSSEPGKRKIVLATSIAETSLTVEGVRVIIDSGLMRVPRYSARTGLSRLETITVSQASADQRRGRAGRVGPGLCYRLWTEQEQRNLAPRSIPEIMEADLTPLALELATWGVTDAAELEWLDVPPATAIVAARQLLQQLGALNDKGMITEHGKKMADLAIHPRLAHMVLKGKEIGLGQLGCELAALLSEKDFMRGAASGGNADLRLRIEALQATANSAGSGASSDMDYDGANGAYDKVLIRQIWQQAGLLKRELGISSDNSNTDHTGVGVLLAFAFPDRIAQRRGAGRFLLSNGRGAAFAELQILSNSPYVVAADLDDQGVDSRIYLAAPLEIGDITKHLSEYIHEKVQVVWDTEVQTVRATKFQRLGALILKEMSVTRPNPEDCLTAVMEGIRKEGLSILPWTRGVRQLQQRLILMHMADSSWPNVEDQTLLDTLEEWLGPHVHGMKSRQELQKLNLGGILEMNLSWDQRRQLDEIAPTHIQVPSGSKIPVDYSDPQAPLLAVRLQEMFGLSDTPRIGGGAVPLVLHLLSPAQRPVQVTRDLASFWREAYFEVKKDLKGRYPKHYWPDDPLVAAPTNRVKPRG